MKRLAGLLLLAGGLSACTPLVLLGKPVADVRVGANVRGNIASDGGVQQGDPLNLEVRVSRDAYVTAFLLPPDGHAVRLGAANTPATASNALTFALPTNALGRTEVFAVAGTSPLPFPDTTPGGGTNGFADWLKASLAGVPDRAWNVTPQYYRATQYGALRVTAFPAGATIQLDGQTVGVAPALLERVEVGAHTLTVSAAGYAPEQRPVSVRAGAVGTEAFTLRRLPRPATLVVTSDAPARVSLDGREAGRTPFTARIRTGERTLKVTPDNTALAPATLRLRAPETAVLTVECRTGTTFTCALVSVLPGE
ncbi:PEGA domain-containing protein [Deinococcus maricopensis]|uniref:PEGA domain protein n=1 Tax=Deinococcus maricopensis (strain DSM 21211 / LMG 22137 / NRRL B-23946 / LB-34) TaxID=709986 RepID=E8U4P5_DEIML|nr:PEGA domain-containing protein [Deinococcus maricopensis]ADV68910.1 PEGA domain protein [Deinococcus maricopensis DSM 21211]